MEREFLVVRAQAVLRYGEMGQYIDLKHEVARISGEDEKDARRQADIGLKFPEIVKGVVKAEDTLIIPNDVPRDLTISLEPEVYATFAQDAEANGRTMGDNLIHILKTLHRESQACSEEVPDSGHEALAAVGISMDQARRGPTYLESGFDEPESKEGAHR